MDLSGLTQASSKLLDALEKLDSSPGADLRSPSGPSGKPPAELVQAFEDALAGISPADGQAGVDQPQSAMKNDTSLTPTDPLARVGEPLPEANGPYAVAEPHGVTGPQELSGAQSVTRPHSIDGVQDADPTTMKVEGVDRPAPSAQAVQSEGGQPSSPLAEVQELLGRVMNGSLSPTELYRLQYLLSMLKLQTDSGTGVSQQASQGLDSLLKQKG